MKPFKNLEEQIDILQKRNMKFKNKSLAEDYLLYNNYYNIINCYSKFFLDSNNKYVPDTYFENIIHVHHFDKEIKAILFKYLIESEKTFKSVFAYRYSEYYKNIPYSYLDINNYDTPNPLKLAKYIAQLSHIISENIKDGNNSISHYAINHKDVPMWVLINNLTFGQVSILYSYMYKKLKNIIAKDLSKFLKANTGIKESILSSEQLESYLFNMIELRNIIAHNNKLLGYKCKKNNKYNSSLHDIHEINRTDPRNDIFNVFITLKCFLSNNDFGQVNNELLNKILNLKNKINTSSFNNILFVLGFRDKLKQLEQLNNE